MKLLNSTTYKGKEYTLEDVRGFIPKETKGLPDGYYGGRVTQLAKTDVKGLYLCMENMKVIDLLLFKDEMVVDLTQFTNKELSKMLEKRGIDVPNKATKAELIELLK